MENIDVIIPVFNSGETIEEVLRKLLATKYFYDSRTNTGQIFLVNDGSTDNSASICKEYSRNHPSITFIDLMRNYGQHAAIFAGLYHSKADLIVTMDDDDQHSPESIQKLVEALTPEYDVVYGVAIEDEHGWFRNWTSRLIKSIFFRMLGIENARHISAFRIIRREVINSIDFSELSNGILDVVINWNTTRIKWISIPMQKRKVGKSGYTFYTLVKFALNMLSNYSIRPLRIASLVGLVSFALSALTALFFAIQSVLGNIQIPGFASISILVATLGSIQLVTLGIIGEYLGKVHEKSIGRPLFTVRSTSKD